MTIPFFKLEQNNDLYYLCKISGHILANISYVARRGQNEEEGAIQRILNKSRIGGIRDFLLNGGFFPNNIILNLVKMENVALYENHIELQEEARIAQVIDGQHRIEGLKEAIKVDNTVGDIEFPVLMTLNFSTAKCAEMFVSINTKQKSVPKSLIYDLYGLLEVPNRDFSLDRGSDIARMLNEMEESPYLGYIKFPGTSRFKGGIQLSTFITNLKPLIHNQNGEFPKYGIDTLESQAKVLINFFSAIQYYYDKEWDKLTNPFLFASGFGASIDVLIAKILPYCFAQRNFTTDLFKSLIRMNRENMIHQSEVKGFGGEPAREYVRNRFSDLVSIEIPRENEFEI